MIVVNTTGRACPESVAMTRAALDKGAEELEVLVDNPQAATNVKRFLEDRGFRVLLQDDDGRLKLTAGRKTEPPVSASQAPAPQVPVPVPVAPMPVPRPAEGLAVLITGKTLGRSDEELGEILVKGFLSAFSQLDVPPRTVALINEGVKLALFDSSSCDHLKNLERKGTNILVCGTCVNHFGITDSVGAGVISTMFEIVEALDKAGRILSL
nr:sulfurtransferase-like selenium metabolism protein YedF [uncultured Fretibacterium sp.]